ncbi:MAG: hypothetical protein ACAH07_02620 [Methylophilaceae bacterium]
MAVEDEATSIDNPKGRKSFINRTFALRVVFLGLVFGAIFSILQITKLFGARYYIDVLGMNIEYFIFSLGLFIVAIGMLTYSGIYLDIFGSGEVQPRLADQKQIESLRAEIRFMQRQSMDPRRFHTTREIDKLVEDSFHRNIKRNIASITKEKIEEILTEKIIQENQTQIIKNKNFVELKTALDGSIGLLHDQIRQQQKNANFNVWVGMLFAIGGLVVMFVFLYMNYMDVEKIPGEGWDQFVINFVPRITFVILFESIAFFFLRAYGEDRSMIRYLRNETTTAESRFAGLMTSILFAEPESLTGSIKSMMTTERNFTIKKGDKLILEALQKDHPVIFESLVGRLVPDLSSRGKTDTPT